MKITKYGKRRTIAYRRKRELSTDYKKRLGFLKSEMPRLVIRKSNMTITVQLIQYKENGDKVLVTATSKELAKQGWKGHTANMPSAYLTGLLAAKKAKAAKVKEAITDLGLQTPGAGSKLYAALKGAVDGGLEVPHDPAVLPKEDRIKGKHIEEYAKKLGKGDEYKKQFSKYTKANFAPEDMQKHFEDIKKKILSQ